MPKYIESEFNPCDVCDYRRCNNCVLHELAMKHVGTPAADVVEVKHGEWVVQKVNGVDSVFTCSVCGREVESANDYFGKPTAHIAAKYPYCHCGAKMYGGRV